jgi:hypothetical protein
MTSKEEKPRWADLAEQTSKETDPQKLTALVQKLCAAIDKKPGLSGDRADSQFDA